MSAFSFSVPLLYLRTNSSFESMQFIGITKAGCSVLFCLQIFEICWRLTKIRCLQCNA